MERQAVLWECRAAEKGRQTFRTHALLGNVFCKSSCVVISTLSVGIESATFACWQIRFKIEVCICSQFPTVAVHWITEVEMVDSVDDLMSSSSLRGIQMSNFEVLDARIASALNRIIHYIHSSKEKSVWRNKKPKKRTVSFVADRSLT